MHISDRCTIARRPENFVFMHIQSERSASSHKILGDISDDLSDKFSYSRRPDFQLPLPNATIRVRLGEATVGYGDAEPEVPRVGTQQRFFSCLLSENPSRAT